MICITMEFLLDEFEYLVKYVSSMFYNLSSISNKVRCYTKSKPVTTII